MKSTTLVFGFLVVFVGLSKNNSVHGPWQSFSFQISQRPLRNRGSPDLLQHQPKYPGERVRRRGKFVAGANKPNNYHHHHHHEEQDDEEPPSFVHQQTKKLPLHLQKNMLTSSVDTALCIIPPDDAWDTLQRARHFAQDKTYHQWPPAVRLIYPFCPRSKLTNLALEVARIVEEHNIEPFTVTLNSWTVMPLPDALHSMLFDAELSKDDDDAYTSGYVEDPRYQEVQDLIASEERKGRERKKDREAKKQHRERLKRQQRHQMEQSNNTQPAAEVGETALFTMTAETCDENEETEEEKSVHKAESQSQSSCDVFNGPSMIALEPDEASSRRLKQLRELIRHELLEEYDPNNPTASLWDASVPLYDTEHHDGGEDEYGDDEYAAYDDFVEEISSFRPLIPIGAFPTIDAAIATARKLKGLWDPLTFTVTDLHFISQIPASRQRLSESNSEPYYDNHQNNVDPVVPPSFHLKEKRNNIRDSVSPFGCDAMVMLMGEEIEMDDESNELLANLVWEEGTPGGYWRNSNSSSSIDHAGGKADNAELQNEALLLTEEEHETSSSVNNDAGDHIYTSFYKTYDRNLDVKEGDWEDLMDWLDADDDDDEMENGTAFVIGRTHIFSGEKRTYLGMPASSITEEEDGTFAMAGDLATWDDEDFRLQ